MSIRSRVTRSHTGNRRSHHALTAPRLSTCADCGEMHVRHHICDNCGKYRGREVIDMVAQIEKKEKKVKARAAALGAPAGGGRQEKTEQQEEEEKSKVASKKPLDAADLSKK